MARLRDAHPDAGPEELQALVTTRGRRRVVAEGAFVGGPFMVLVPFAFCAALLAQARTILELAGLDGRDTTDPARAAELLVLQGVYADVGAAAKGLESGPEPPPERRGRLSSLWVLVLRMARLLGLVTPDEAPRRLVRIGQWTLLAVVFLTGLVAPLVWLPYMAFNYQRATRRLNHRAAVFYFGGPGPAARRPGRLDPGTALAALRGAGSLLVVVVAVALVLLTDVGIAGRRWPVLTAVLVSGSFLMGGVWLWRRRRRRREDSAGEADREDPP
ncbi:hypothetical protein [Streptomyces sp. NPDC058745]|uniref:hypothetical protein n=1 Tax=Streptomyces sp. NPDC058745 TaxID=3346621 RepID=UPI0036C870BB